MHRCAGPGRNRYLPGAALLAAVLAWAGPVWATNSARTLQETLAANAVLLQSRQREKQLLSQDLVRMARQSITLQEQYQQQYQTLQALLVGALRVARTPPETILSQPQAPENVIRSTLVLRMMIADMNSRMTPLRDELASVLALERQISDRKAALTRLEQTLVAENRELEDLIARHQQQIAEHPPIAETVHIPEQASQPADLVPDPMVNDPVLPSPRWVAPLAGAQVPPPADHAANHQGIWIEGTPGDMVLSPADGIVRYVGPFRGYGQIIIIRHGSGYHSLMAGIDTAMVRAGQSVLGGEPLARLQPAENSPDQGSSAPASVAAMPPGATFRMGEVSKTHLLYFEVRYHGKSEMPDRLASLFKKKDSLP